MIYLEYNIYNEEYINHIEKEIERFEEEKMFNVNKAKAKIDSFKKKSIELDHLLEKLKNKTYKFNKYSHKPRYISMIPFLTRCAFVLSEAKQNERT